MWMIQTGLRNRYTCKPTMQKNLRKSNPKGFGFGKNTIFDGLGGLPREVEEHRLNASTLPYLRIIEYRGALISNSFRCPSS